MKPGTVVWSVIALTSLSLLFGTIAFTIISGSGNTDLSVDEEGWAGSSKLHDEISSGGFDATSVLSTPSLLYEEEEPEKTLFLSLGPGREYSLTEQHAINKFVSRGGRMIYADDGSNGLSSRFEINFIDGQLYDQNFVQSPDLVKFDVSTDFFEGIILMNRPGSLTFSAGQALIASTTSAWVDRNGNGINDNVTTNQGEAQGIRYLSVITDPAFSTLGTGAAVFISDPSLFMNGMIEREDNLEFALSLIEYMLPDGGKVVFDESVHSSPGSRGAYKEALMGIGRLATDVNLKIVLGSLAVLSMMAVGYIYESPGRPRHDVILSRTGVAEMIEPDLLESDMDELKKVVLDRIRIQSGMSVDEMSALSWSELRDLLQSDELYRFIRRGKFKGGTEKLLLEVMEWERR